jgi:hypothetical protein
MYPIVEKHLSSPAEGFKTYIEAQQWINEQLDVNGLSGSQTYLRLHFCHQTENESQELYQ